MYWYRYYDFFHNINSLWKHFINVPRLIWSSVVMIENEKPWKHVSTANWRVIIHGMIETFGKSKVTQKIKYTEYIHVIDVAWKKLQRCIVMSDPTSKNRCLHAHDTHPPLRLIPMILSVFYIILKFIYCV